MPRIPDQWRGACEIGTMFNTSNCNRKLIGARSFSKALKHACLTIGSNDYDSPRDVFGHGSDTSSTAAGSHVIGAEYFDPISLGAFAAIEKGIFVACSAANRGPDAYTTTNGAPWITTVGAGTLDRDYAALVTLGEGTITFKGKSVYPENLYIYIRSPSLLWSWGQRKDELQPTVTRAKVWAPSGMKLSITPSSLIFEGKYSKAEFLMHVDIDLRGYGMHNSYIGNYGHLSWHHEVNWSHVVRSPVVSAYAIGKFK
ncbi:hypothetical protein Syun_015298 [Stephania yunnanensis]|uniref:Peptidase S8/S53 domain-containing protein n=1 Tax=Stephania yunnanensis TaxID=152371 RepID=A0AAP0P985_9MAGN